MRSRRAPSNEETRSTEALIAHEGTLCDMGGPRPARCHHVQFGEGLARLSQRRYNKVSDGSTEVTTLSVSYDGVAMITRWEHKDSDPATVVGFAYARDKLANPGLASPLTVVGVNIRVECR